MHSHTLRKSKQFTHIVMNESGLLRNRIFDVSHNHVWNVERSVRPPSFHPLLVFGLCSEYIYIYIYIYMNERRLEREENDIASQ